MNTIHHLPQELISKIAAGEVIERPAYAVKELVENAIDAKATHIIVNIKKAGLEQIIVIDNGLGMSKEDITLAFLPHTTSKLKEGDDLLGIATLGFRGEALSSIAAISTLTLKSRPHNNPGGYEVIISNGTVESTSAVGIPPGTIVQVDSLFNNVPARKKFLKTEQTEFRLITDLLINYALSLPHIHFTLTHNNKTILDLPRRLDNKERIRNLLGQSLFDQLLPLSYEDGYIQLEGFIGKPQSASKQNQKQFLFVNNRSVSDKMISLAVKESFGTLLPASNTPVFLLHLTLPKEIVDVNVHPRKETVSFINAKNVFDAIKHTVSQVLQENNLTFNLAKYKDEHSAKTGETESFASDLIKQAVLPWDRTFDQSVNNKLSVVQIHQTYIITQTKEGILLIDQHAAHERILFNHLSQEFLKQKRESLSYQLKSPKKVSLSISESQLFNEHHEIFKQLGFTIDPFPDTTLLIRSAPKIFKGRNLEKIIREVLSDLEMDIMKDIDMRTQRMIAFLACRAAVKSGDLLSDNQMRDILKELDNTSPNETCPHGRPTRVLLSIEYIHKLFKR